MPISEDGNASVTMYVCIDDGELQRDSAFG